MKAVRVLQFGPPSVITNDDLPRPEPVDGQLLVRVKAAGVGNWDALIREGKLPDEHLPLILGSELSGLVNAIGAEVSGFKIGDEVYGATNEQFTGAYAEYALPWARMMALRPKTLNFVTQTCSRALLLSPRASTRAARVTSDSIGLRSA